MLPEDLYKDWKRGDPIGRYNPLYQREHYRSESPRWRKVTRFIPNDYINWA